MTPEQQARQQIDAQLIACGWVIQNYAQFNPAAAHGVALREVPLKSGQCDYLLLVDRKPVGVIEAKKEGTLLSGVAEQPSLIPKGFGWDALIKLDGDDLETHYRHMLLTGANA